MLLNPVSQMPKKNQTISVAKTIGHLPSYQCDVSAAATVESVIERLKKQPELPGVLLRRGGEFLGAFSRLKIFEWLGRPYGVELFFKKPIIDLYASFNVSSEIYPGNMSINEAVQKSLLRSPEVRYEPVIVSFGEEGLRLLDINVLLLAQSDQLANANHIIEKQLEIGKVLSSSLELPKVLALILEQMDLIIPYSRAAILLYRNNEMEFATSQGYPEDVSMEEARIMVNNNKIFTNIIHSRKPTRVKDASMNNDWQHIPGTPQTRSWLGVPLVQNEDVLGMLSVSRLDVDPFTRDEVEISSIFAGQAAVALGNANLYERIQSFNHELEERVRERTHDLQQAYYKLESLDKNKSDFIKISSHEIKTPITVISGYAQMLSLDNSLGPHQHELIKNMTEGMRRLGDIVNTMLDVARLDTREMELEFKEVDLEPLLTEIVENLSPSLIERKLTCSIKDVKNLPTCQGDADALRKAFHHLIVNAIKYTPDGGHISVNGRAPGVRDSKTHQSSLQITVMDTGIGIDPKNHQLIFDKFFQTGKLMLHSSGRTKFKGGGTGLGLSVAQGLIDAHGGQIWAESPGQDEATCPGSSFNVILPITKLRAKI
jgi:signal transduction histidine kinase